MKTKFTVIETKLEATSRGKAFRVLFWSDELDPPQRFKNEALNVAHFEILLPVSELEHYPIGAVYTLERSL